MSLIEKAGRPALVDHEGRRIVPAAIFRSGRYWLVVANCPRCDRRLHGKMRVDDDWEPLWDSFHFTKRTCGCALSLLDIRLLEVYRHDWHTCGKRYGAHDLSRYGRLEVGSNRLYCAECNPEAETRKDDHDYDEFRRLYPTGIPGTWVSEFMAAHPEYGRVYREEQAARRQERLAAHRAGMALLNEGRYLS